MTSFTTTTGKGWQIFSGTLIAENYYMAEWRNHDGFDVGLKYAYDTTYLRDGAWKVERAPYNAPGMLVWYRDFTYGEGLNFTNLTLNNLGGLPSHGTKGGLLLVDSHFDPLRRQGVAADKDPTTLNNLPSRPQSSNVAFSLRRTYEFTECLEAPGEPFSECCTTLRPAEWRRVDIHRREGLVSGYRGARHGRSAAVLLQGTRTRRLSCRRPTTSRTRSASPTRTATYCLNGLARTSVWASRSALEIRLMTASLWG